MITQSLFVPLKSPAWYTVNITSVQTQQGDDHTVFIRTTKISSLVSCELLFKHSRGMITQSLFVPLKSPAWYVVNITTLRTLLSIFYPNFCSRFCLHQPVPTPGTGYGVKLSQKWLSNGRMTQLSQGNGPTGNSEVHYLTTTTTTSNKAPSTDAKVSYLLCESKLSFATLSGQHNPTSFSPLLVHSHFEEPVIADNCCCHQTLTKPSTKKKQLQMPPYSKS